MIYASKNKVCLKSYHSKFFHLGFKRDIGAGKRTNSLVGHSRASNEGERVGGTWPPPTFTKQKSFLQNLFDGFYIFPCPLFPPLSNLHQSPCIVVDHASAGQALCLPFCLNIVPALLSKHCPVLLSKHCAWHFAQAMGLPLGPCNWPASGPVLKPLQLVCPLSCAYPNQECLTLMKRPLSEDIHLLLIHHFLSRSVIPLILPTQRSFNSTKLWRHEILSTSHLLRRVRLKNLER